MAFVGLKGVKLGCSLDRDFAPICGSGKKVDSSLSAESKRTSRGYLRASS